MLIHGQPLTALSQRVPHQDENPNNLRRTPNMGIQSNGDSVTFCAHPKTLIAKP
jgi:hypothetical protein